MDSADTPRPQYELARLTELPPALRAPLPPATQQPGGGGPPINPRLVLRGLARHWWQALALWVVGTAALAALVYLRYEPTYRSFSLVRIEPGGTNPYVADNPNQQSGAHLQTQVQLVTSPNVLSAVATDPAVMGLQSLREAPDAEAFLRDLVQVVPRHGTNLIEVAAETKHPDDAATIVNAVVDSFIAFDSEWSDARSRRTIEKFRQYADELATKVEAQEQLVVQLTRESEHPTIVFEAGPLRPGGAASGTGTASDDPQIRVDRSKHDELHQKLLDLEFAEVEAQADLEAARRQAAAIDPRVWSEHRIEEAFKSDERVRALREELRDLDVRIAEAERRIRNPADPAVSRLKLERRRVYERYEQLWADLEPALRAQLAHLEGNPTQIVRQAEARLMGLAHQREMVRKQLDLIDLGDKSRGVDALKLHFATTKLEQLRAKEELVRDRIEVLSFDQRGTSDAITVIAEARPSYVPLVNKRDKFLALTPLAMLGLVLGLVTLVELRAGRVSGTDDLSGRVAAEVFAVPPLPTARTDARGRLEGPGADPKFERFIQQLDHLRVALCGEGGHDGRGRCVLITSAVGGEGKTTLAAQLAVRCAEAGATTVLIDADLRRATLGRLFEVPECPGLSDVLRGDATLEDALVPISQVGGCQLLPAGSPEPNPNRILRGKAFAPMLERLRRSFDVVIIDTSPVLPVPDALILGRLADGAVLATRHDQSRFPAVERANGLLAGAGIPVLGVVVNGARASDRRFAGAGYASYSYRSDRVPEGANGSSAS